MKIFSTLLVTLFFCCSNILDLKAQRIGASEVGNAVYYADYLHGRKTASGEFYDKNAYTASHKSYSYGTLLRVTRLDNGKTVNVRVNDRGPFGEGLIIDISRVAASQIGLLRDGKARVRIEVIGFSKDNPSSNRPAVAYNTKNNSPSSYNTYRPRITNPDPNTTAALQNLTQVLSDNNTGKSYNYSRFDQPENNVRNSTTPSSYSNEVFTARGGNNVYKNNIVYGDGFVVQVGAYGEFSNANRKAESLKRNGLSNVFVVTKQVGSKTLNKVVVGPYNSRSAAEGALRNIRGRYAENGYVTKP